MGIASGIRAVQQVIRERISFTAVSILLAAAVIFHISVQFGVLKEDSQEWLFPLVLLFFVRVPRRQEHRLPLVYAALALVLWGSFHARAIMLERNERRQVYLSRLESDQDGLRARAFVHRFNEIALTYELPSIALLHRSFLADDQARQWLKEKPGSAFVVSGQPDWMRVVFACCANSLARSFKPVLSAEEFPPLLEQSASALSINLREHLLAVRLPLIGVPLVLVWPPEAFHLPGDPLDLSLHFLAWLNAAFEQMPYAAAAAPAQPERDRALRFAALSQAADTLGLWKSNGPLGLAQYLLGTIEFLSLLADENFDDRQFEQVLGRFGRAAALAGAKTDPEVFAAALNNAAVAAVAKGTEEDLRRAGNWLWLAGNVRNFDGSPVLGAKAAVLNGFLFDSQR